ncbi:MAG: hypothetical protein ABIC04_01795 [Nanoarchaeota archaeon]
MKYIIIVLLIGILLAGCGKPAEKDIPLANDVIEQASAESYIDSGMGDLDSLEEDLDNSDLNNIDKDLSEIDW